MVLSGVVEDDDISWERIVGFNMRSDKSKYIMRRLGKYSGGVTHVNLTIPTYLLNHVEARSSSKSLLVTLIVEEYFRRYDILDSKFPNLSSLYFYLLEMDGFAERVKKTGGRDLKTDRGMRAYRAYLNKFKRVVQRRINEMAGFETAPKRLRVVIPAPHIRTRPDRRRQTDSESEQELGAEAYADRTDEKNEMYRTDRDRFRQLWPDEYAERRRQDEQRLEDERQDPPDWKEDGGDPPEN